MTLSNRKQYAKKCFLRGNTNTRAFDNCFEMGDGDKVVKYLMDLCLFSTPENKLLADDINSKGRILGSKEDKFYRKLRESEELTRAIKRDGSWDYWLYFYNNGTYEGFSK
jgi:hypothetical protein